MLWRVMVRRGISRSVASGAISALPGADCGEAKTMQTLCGTLCGDTLSAGTPLAQNGFKWFGGGGRGVQRGRRGEMSTESLI